MFRVPLLSEKLETDGYVLIDGLEYSQVDDCFYAIRAEFEEVKNIIKKNNNEVINVDFHSTFLDHHKPYKEAIYKCVSSLIIENLSDYFLPFKILQANLFNKTKGKGTIVPHQNLTTVDETLHSSYSIWVPFNNTDETNGTIYLAPKSHKKFEKYRNHNKHWAPLYASIDISDYQMIPINVKKGQVLIFNDSLVHASPINRTDESRIVFHALIAPLEAKTVYCSFKSDRVDLIKVSEDFWKFFTPGDKEPVSPIYKSFSYKDRVYTKESIIRELKS